MAAPAPRARAASAPNPGSLTTAALALMAQRNSRRSTGVLILNTSLFPQPIARPLLEQPRPKPLVMAGLYDLWFDKTEVYPGSRAGSHYIEPRSASRRMYGGRSRP